MPKEQECCIGLDLGDTFFRISYLDLKDQTPRLVADPEGNTVFPSQVSFKATRQCLVGIHAKRSGKPEDTVLHPITLAGSSLSDLAHIQDRYQYKFERGRNGEIEIKLFTARVSVSDVLVAIFKHIKQLAENHLGKEVTHIVIAVPDGSGNPKRIAIRDAAQAAGFQVRQLINQTVAAALGLGYGINPKLGSGTVGLIDVGASHSSFSLLNHRTGNVALTKVRSCKIGTTQFQQRLVKYFNQHYLTQAGVDLLESGRIKPKFEMNFQAQRTLHELSSKRNVMASMGAIGSGGSTIFIEVTREKLEQLIAEDLKQVREVIINGANPDTIICIGGGGAAIPIVEQMVRTRYGARLQRPHTDPSQVIALGAAIKSGVYQGLIKTECGDKLVIHEITGFDLGTYYQNDLMYVLIPRGTKIPHRSEPKTFNMSSRQYTEKVYQWIGLGSGDNKKEPHPDLITIAKETVSVSGHGISNTFIIDENGIVTFIVGDLGTDKEITLADYKPENF